jgi:hypothetical protein
MCSVCFGIEALFFADTEGEYGAVTIICKKCGREITIEDVSDATS